MNVEVRPIKTAAETALATNFAMAKRALLGAPAVAALKVVDVKPQELMTSSMSGASR